MSNAALKVLAGAGAKGDPVYVDDLFSTFVYDGNRSTQTITNGIDLSGEGALVWLKGRDASGGSNHRLYDTERGANKSLVSNSNAAETTHTDQLTSFNSDGFSIGASADINWDAQPFGTKWVTWTFRKQPGFFDIVTWTGNGVSGREIPHNLGSVPGMILVKNLSFGAADWRVFHRSLGPTKNMLLNGTNAALTQTGMWNDTAPTSTVFTVGNDGGVNGNASTYNYVAYVFAHDAQDFGENSNEAIIKCGSYTGNGSSTGPSINLGFEPQWLMIKSTANNSGEWVILDNIRGIAVADTDQWVAANSSTEEQSFAFLDLTATGFNITNSGYYSNSSGVDYVYMAIRRPHKPASDFAATNLFSLGMGLNASAGAKVFSSAFPVDTVLSKLTSGTGDWYIRDRVRPYITYLNPNTTGGGSNNTYENELDHMDGVYTTSASNATSWMSWLWRRAPGFFDVVTYKGNNSNPRTLNHNLGVAPEMMWIKLLGTTQDWDVYVKVGGTEYGYYGVNAGHSGLIASMSSWSDTSPTATQFTVSSTNNNGSYHFICYLWASVPGISKFGAYSGTGSELTVDCGFSAGARFVLLKRIDAAMGASGQGWFVFDTVRGITSSSSPYLPISDTDAQASGSFVKPDSSGFKVTTESVVNTNGGTYMFYAIA